MNCNTNINNNANAVKITVVLLSSIFILSPP
nr:MAG TPA: hypothetical protein [Caudoviricetes sp.]